MNRFFNALAFAAMLIVSQNNASQSVKKEVTPSRIARLATSIKSVVVNAPSNFVAGTKAAFNTVAVKPTVASINFVKAHPYKTSALLGAIVAAAAAVYAYNQLQTNEEEVE